MPEKPSASFEEALARVEQIVRELEGDQIDLERSVTLYEEGRKLVAACEAQLRTAEERLRDAAAEANAPPRAAADDEIAF